MGTMDTVRDDMIILHLAKFANIIELVLCCLATYKTNLTYVLSARIIPESDASNNSDSSTRSTSSSFLR